MIIPKEEVEKAFVEAVDNMNKLVPMDEFDTIYFNKGFHKAIEFSEEYVQKYVQDIIIENQGLKLYKDNEAKRFKKLAVNFAYYCLMQDWLQNGFRCGGLSTEEIYDKFINDPDENI